MKKIIAIYILFLFVACTNEKNDCFKTQGDTITKVIALSAFDTVVVNERLNLVLVESSQRKAVVSGGEYILSDVIITNHNNKLNITNNNSCSFWRSRKDFMTITLYAPEFKNVGNNGEGKVSNLDTLHGDEIWITGVASNGEFDLTIAANRLFTKIEGLALANIDGEVDYSYVYNFGGSLLDQSSLKAREVYLWHETTGESRVYADSVLGIENHAFGEIYYKGSPDSITIQEFKNAGTIIKN